MTEDALRAQLGPVDERAAEAALGNIGLVVVSPDGRASVSVTEATLPALGAGGLEAAVQAVREANAGSIAGIGDVEAESIMLDGVDAVRLSYAAGDPATQEANRRVIRQVISIVDDRAIVLTFVVREDDAAVFEETFRQIEESWRWQL